MQTIANGIITGCTIALLALAFTVVYLPTRIFHIALGGVYALAPFIMWFGLARGWPWYVGSFAAVISGIAVSLACEYSNHMNLERRSASPGAHLISSLGLYIVIVQGITLIWGNETKQLRERLETPYILSNVVLTGAQITAAIIALLVLALFFIWLLLSARGLHFRALSDNPKEIALRGYNVSRLRLLAFGLSGLLGSTGSLLVAYDIGFDPHGGFTAVLLAVVATIIGGRYSFLGPVIGGLLLGLVRAEVTWFFSARWQDAATFLLLTLFLFVRPNGLLGRGARLEAEA